MNINTLVACAVTACALPLAPAMAQVGAQPTGPQGTGVYRAFPVTAPSFAQLDTNRDGVISRDEYALMPAQSGAPRRNPGPLVGPSWDTNPPAPPQ